MFRLGNSQLLSLGDAARLAAASPKCAVSRLRDKAFGIDDLPFPRRIILHLANRCNFACPMCSLGAARAERQKQFRGDMPFEIVEKSVAEAGKHGSYVDLLGGEPSLYKHLGETIGLLTKHRLLSFITTNGFNLKKRAAEMVEAGLKVLLISMDGWDEASSYQRGKVPGSFDAIRQGIEEVRRARGTGFFPIIRISSVITKQNHHSIDRIAEAVYQMGVRRWTIQNYFFITDQAMSAHRRFQESTGIGEQLSQHHISGSDSYLAHDEVVLLRESLARLRKRLQGPLQDLKVDFDWNVDLDRYYSNEAPSSSSTCEMPRNRVDIYPDGRIAVCADAYTVGNINNQTIESAWQGPEMQYFRSVLRQHKMMPMCFRCCGIVNDLKFDDVPAMAAMG